MTITHYILDDGRIWHINSAEYVGSMPKGAVSSRPVAPDGKTADEEGLEFCLRSFGYQLGKFKNDQDYAFEARMKRNQLLSETDYLAMPDYPLEDSKKASILSYRQSLRDITKQSGFPRQITWPEKPEI